MIQLYIIIALALTFDFINGFHDTANAIATAVSTRALTLRRAILMAAVMNFIGAMLFTGVAETIATGIVDLNMVKDGHFVVMAALISAIIWNIWTWFFGIPSSSSHALIGSLAGAALADGGSKAVHFAEFGEIFTSLIISPIFAIGAGFVIFKIVQKCVVRASIYKTNYILRKIQVFTAAIQAFSHGSNDAQKSMGIITLALVTFGVQDQMQVPHWVQLLCAMTMAVGTSIGGWRIIKTVGTQIMKLEPINAVAADLTSSLVIQIATHINMPVSTTHVISSSIMGVGASERVKKVKWATAKKMVSAWFITIPITIGLSYIIFLCIKLGLKL